MLVGPSTGSVMTSMMNVSKKAYRGIIVGIFADNGRKFNSLYAREGIFVLEEHDMILESAKNISKLAYCMN